MPRGNFFLIVWFKKKQRINNLHIKFLGVKLTRVIIRHNTLSGSTATVMKLQNYVQISHYKPFLFSKYN